jgi:copper chaperone
MIEIEVGDMSCGHCVGRVTQAVKDVDEAARVEVNLADKRVSIASDTASAEFEQAIRAAGYTPVPVAARDA